MSNNSVSVGHTNTGNVSGGDLLINYSLPCKNGDGTLTYEDYQRMSYCNKCIASFRNQTFFRYQKHAITICWIVSALLIGGFYFIMQRLPNFMGVIFQTNPFITPLIPIISTLALCCVIFLTGRIYARVLAKRYNNQYLAFH
ncbi:hypothetical protein [Acinetobacter soli]|uniref:Uncharacterized protein n=1 Tax=Acinetobacter soli TaxID=487316 RepID=A0AB38YZ08_9GAMM|nr:hypothetical protein [Acinetobacter soli]WND06647.1 hypothetical protein RHP80_05755 [Acinetobacter soli]